MSKQPYCKINIVVFINCKKKKEWLSSMEYCIHSLSPYFLYYYQYFNILNIIFRVMELNTIIQADTTALKF